MKIPCPKCGADISYDPSSGKLYCEYCGSYSDISELEVHQYENQKVESDYQETNIYDEFHCSSCGAKLVTDKTTTITRCVFCGSQQLIKQRLTGKFEPKKVIPFKINHNKFIEIYKSFINNKKLAPDEFRNNPMITETRGLYVPFYLYNYSISTYGRGEASYHHDDSTYYKWFENQMSEDSLITIDGSARLDDSIMSSLEPFNTKEIVNFNPAYLSGFQAECTDEANEALQSKAELRAVSNSISKAKNFVPGYNYTGGLIISDLKKTSEEEYVLFPVWFVNTAFDNKKYSYAVNGQTGKVVGEVPLSPKKFGAVMTALVITACMLTVGYLNLMSGRSRNDDSNPIGALILIWGGIVIAPYYGIKSKYKNVTYVLSNPIKTWNQKTVKNNSYTSKKAYLKEFPNDNLKILQCKKYIDGEFKEDVNMSKLSKDISSSDNKNYTINKDEL